MDKSADNKIDVSKVKVISYLHGATFIRLVNDLNNVVCVEENRMYITNSLDPEACLFDFLKHLRNLNNKWYLAFPNINISAGEFLFNEIKLKQFNQAELDGFKTARLKDSSHLLGTALLFNQDNDGKKIYDTIRFLHNCALSHPKHLILCPHDVFLRMENDNVVVGWI